jgi:hypothetical protein
MTALRPNTAMQTGDAPNDRRRGHNAKAFIQVS